MALIWGALPLRALEMPLPRGAQPLVQESEALDQYALPVGVFAGDTLPRRIFEGAVQREAWRLESDSLTNLQLLGPMREALTAAGYEILLDCADQLCGGFDFRFATEVLPPPQMHVNLSDYHFVSARKGAQALSILVSGSRTARFVQIIRVQEPGALGSQLQTSPAFPSSVVSSPGLPVAPSIEAIRSVPLPPASLQDVGAALETAGRVVLDDLNFETGSATLGSGPFTSLQSLAAYLAANPARRVALVGHTDAVGGLDGNIALSRRRAEAALTRLAEVHDVPRDQLEAGGMGYLAPRGSNLTPEGRARNRRVEAVLVSTD